MNVGVVGYEAAVLELRFSNCCKVLEDSAITWSESSFQPLKDVVDRRGLGIVFYRLGQVKALMSRLALSIADAHSVLSHQISYLAAKRVNRFTVMLRRGCA